MSDQMRLVEAYYSPTQVFSLYDYTKIIYPIDGYICIRQIVTPNTKPSFIKLEHEYSKILTIMAFPNTIVTVEQKQNQNLLFGFYDNLHTHINIHSSLIEQEYSKKSTNSKTQLGSNAAHLRSSLFSLKEEVPNIKVTVRSSQMNVLVLIESLSKDQSSEPNDNQIIILNPKSKKVIAQGFLQGNFKEICFKDDLEFSVLYQNSSLSEFQLYENDAKIQNVHPFFIMKKKDIFNSEAKNAPSLIKIVSHTWMKEELIIMKESLDVQVYLEGKKTESIQKLSCCRQIQPLICGFALINDNFLKVYKKVEINYVCVAEFFIPEIGFSQKIVLSPQEDILSFYISSNSSIRYCKSFSNEIQISQQKGEVISRQIKHDGEIQFKKFSDLKIQASRMNNTFTISEQSNISFYSLATFENFMKCCIESESHNVNSPTLKGKLKRMNTLGAPMIAPTIGKPEPILQVALHPTMDIIALAFKNKIRIYQILYCEIQQLKEVSLSGCTSLSYSNTGSFLNAVVSGKNGSKCYIYRTQEEYDLYECLSIGKKIESFVWSKYDIYLFGVYQNGFYRWTGVDGFKSKIQLKNPLKFTVKGSILNFERDKLILYGANHILELSQAIIGQQNYDHINDSVIECPKIIKQIAYQSGHYFVNIIETTENQKQGDSMKPTSNFQSFLDFQQEEQPEGEEMIIKCSKLTNFWEIPQMMDRVSQSNIYREVSSLKNKFRMLPVKQSNLILLDEKTLNIKILEWGKPVTKNFINNSDLVKMDRKKIVNLYKKYQDYEEQVRNLEYNLKDTIVHLKNELKEKEQKKEEQFVTEISGIASRYEKIKTEKQQLENSIDDKIYKHQEKTIKEVQQLEKMYERKIAVTMNKLLTSEEINYRNVILAENNLSELEKRSNYDIEKIRHEYKLQLTQYMNEKDALNDEVYRLQKEYETRMYDMEQENEAILEDFQSRAEEKIKVLKKNLVSWQIRHSEVLSKKDNVEKALEQQQFSNEILRDKITYLQSKNKEMNKKAEYLQYEIQKYENLLEQKNTSLSIFEERVNDLQKSNEIMKYRVIELKGETEPQEEENSKLRDNLNELEEEYDKIAKSAHEKEQLLTMYKKQNTKQKEYNKRIEVLNKKIEKSYLELVDKVRQITKCPIQQIRKKLLTLLHCIEPDKNTTVESIANLGGKTDSTVGELNRIREHLEVSLDAAVGSNKKGEQQKQFQVMKKNRQNSELIKEINELRRRVRDLEAKVKEKNLQISRVLRGEPISNEEFNIRSSHANLLLEDTPQKKEFSGNEAIRQNQTGKYFHHQKPYSTHKPYMPSYSRSQGRKNTNESQFEPSTTYEKSLFKSSSVHWTKEKRLKTQHSNRRQSHSRSFKRNQSGKYLHIENSPNGPTQQDVEDLRQIIEQKELIIKQLINKVQSLT